MTEDEQREYLNAKTEAEIFKALAYSTINILRSVPGAKPGAVLTITEGLRSTVHANAKNTSFYRDRADHIDKIFDDLQDAFPG